uniref:Secreted protein n=1 Tax=Arundo donax TaxID=35708 RepID=A0A0A9F7C6_ARUDO
MFLYFLGLVLWTSPSAPTAAQYLRQPSADEGSDVSGGIGFLGQDPVFAEFVFPRRQSTCYSSARVHEGIPQPRRLELGARERQRRRAVGGVAGEHRAAAQREARRQAQRTRSLLIRQVSDRE